MIQIFTLKNLKGNHERQHAKRFPFTLLSTTRDREISHSSPTQSQQKRLGVYGRLLFQKVCGEGFTQVSQWQDAAVFQEKPLSGTENVTLAWKSVCD